MRDRDTIFKELKAYTEGLAYKEKLMAEGKAVVVIPEQRRDAIELLCDTLELLKAQEPIEPVKVNRYMDTDDNGNWYSPNTYDCGGCGIELPNVASYCPLCGRMVKWE